MFRKLFITYIIIILLMVMSTSYYSVFICISIGLLFAYMFARKITEPIDELTEAADEISKGNYDKRVHISSKDQIGTLAETFNKMSREMKYKIIELNDQNSKIESIVSSMFNGIIAVDFNYKVLLMNPVCYDIFDIKKNAEKQLLHDVIRNDNLFEIIEEVAKTKQNKIYDFNYYDKNMIFRIYASIINSVDKQFGNEDIGFLLVFQDITQIKKLETMRKDFVSNVSHELKTPLTSIKGFVDTLKEGAVDNRETALKFLDIIDIETDRLYRLIQDILTLSEIENKKTDENIKLNNLEEILNYSIQILEGKAEEKNIIIEKQINSLPLFLCNKDKISQMFINIIDNAIKYTEKGKIFISGKKENQFIEFTIQDTGIGIPKENLDRIFERFYRVDKGRSRKMGGTGLGLSIVKHIVELYDGEITIDSQFKKGTKFIIKFPIPRNKFYKNL